MPEFRLAARDRRAGAQFRYQLGGADRPDAHGTFAVTLEGGQTYWATLKDVEMLRESLPSLETDPATVTQGQGEPPVAILNAPPAAWGDALLVLRAIQLWHDRTGQSATGFFSPLAHRVIPLARRVPALGAFGPLPVPRAELHRYATVYDLDGLWSTAQETAPPLDRMLRRLGIDPATVPAEAKVPTWTWAVPPDPLLVASVTACTRTGKPLLLLAPKASQHSRTMPRPFLDRLLPVLAQHWLVLHADPDLPQDPLHGIVRLRAASDTIDDFAWLVAQADAVLTVDSLAYHLAAALGVPALVCFTTIEPRHRIRDYPTCRGLVVGHFATANISLDPGLPPAAHEQLYAAWCALDPYAVAAGLATLPPRRPPCPTTSPTVSSASTAPPGARPGPAPS